MTCYHYISFFSEIFKKPFEQPHYTHLINGSQLINLVI